MNTTPKDATPKPDTEGKRKRGTQPGNTNAIRHGLKSGKLPKGAEYIEHRLNQFRRTLEEAVLTVRGEITIDDAACIQTAIRWERHATLAQRWLTKQYDELKPLDRLSFSREIARASGERDKAIRALNLDRDRTHDAIAALYAPQLLAQPNGDTSDESE
jgi:hypothetical protein